MVTGLKAIGYNKIPLILKLYQYYVSQAIDYWHSWVTYIVVIYSLKVNSADYLPDSHEQTITNPSPSQLANDLGSYTCSWEWLGVLQTFCEGCLNQ